jgi:hypothetical protein
LPDPISAIRSKPLVAGDATALIEGSDETAAVLM